MLFHSWNLIQYCVCRCGRNGWVVVTVSGFFAVAAARINDRPVLITGGSDGVSVWDAEKDDVIWGDFDDRDWVWSVATAEVEGRSRIASGHGNGSILLRDMADGVLVHEFSTEDYHNVLALAFGEVDGSTVLIAGSGRTIRLWDAVTGEPVGEPMEDATGEALWSLAFIVLDGRPCVLAGTGSTDYDIDGSLSVWDLQTCERYGKPMMFPAPVWSVSDPSKDSVAVGYGREVAVLRRR